MTFHTQIAEAKEAYGLFPGDIIRTSANNTLYRYKGVRKGLPEGFEDKFPDQEFLVFDTGIPIYTMECTLPYKFLATQEPKSIHGSNILNVPINEIEVLGNIEDKLWHILTTFTKWHLDEIKLKQKDKNTSLGLLLESYLRYQQN